MTARNRARLTATDFDSLVADLNKEQSDRLGLGWAESEGGHNPWEDVDPNLPRMVYNGPESEFTATMEIERWPTIVYDTNGYYAALGVSFKATDAQLIAAYTRIAGFNQENDPSGRLTYILKTLLDDKERAKYDATPLGKFKVDRFIEEQMMIADKWEASQAMARGDVTFDELMDYQQALAGLDDEGGEVDDEALARSRDRAATSRHEIEGGGQWRWSYFLLRSTCDDHSRLARWQALLVRYISRKRKGVRVAIGFVGETESPFEVKAVGSRTVVFLNDGIKPSRRLAKQATSAVVKHIRAQAHG